MRTLISVQMQAVNPDGSPALGTVCVKPTASDYDVTIYSAGPACGPLDAYGRLTAQNAAGLNVFASDDEGFDTTYNVQINLYGQPLQEFNCKVPADATATELAAQTTINVPTITLTSLVVSNAMLGQAIVGDNWPEGTIVRSLSSFSNTLTLSENATETGVCEATVGGAVLMETLEENRL